MTHLEETTQSGIIRLRHLTLNADRIMPDIPGFAERLKTLRKQHSFSQTELGKRVGIHYTHVGRYEAGRAKPTAETLQKLAAALGVTTDYLIEGATNDSAAGRLADKELLSLFQQVEELNNEDKHVVKRLLQSFLTMNKISEMTRKAS